MSRIALLCFVLVGFLGCGSSREEFAFSQTPAGLASTGELETGQVVIAFDLEPLLGRGTLIPGNVERLRVSGYTADGRLFYGPLEVEMTPELVLGGVPTEVSSLRLEYFERLSTERLGVAVVPVVVPRSEVVVITSPPFDNLYESIDEIRISPPVLRIGPGGTGQLQAYGRLQDGSEVEITEFVTWSSEDPDLLQIQNLPSRKGRVDGRSEQFSLEVEAALPTGKPQLAVAGDRTLSLYPLVGGSGIGQPIASSEKPLALLALDVNLDGHDEVVIFDSGSPCKLRILDRAGALVGESSLGGVIGEDALLSVTKLDLNDDGHEDLLMAVFSPWRAPQLYAFLGRDLATSVFRPFLVPFPAEASSNFARGGHISAASDAAGTRWLALGAGSGGGPEVQVYRIDPVFLSQGELLFFILSFQHRSLAFPPNHAGGVQVQLAPFSGDGSLLLLAAGGEEGRLSAYLRPLLGTQRLREFRLPPVEPETLLDSLAVSQRPWESSDAGFLVASPESATFLLLDGRTGEELGRTEMDRGFDLRVAAPRGEGVPLRARARVVSSIAGLTRLRVVPDYLELTETEPVGEIRVVADFDDGSTVDVTENAELLLPENGLVARSRGVARSGILEALKSGRGMVQARYLGGLGRGEVVVNLPESAVELYLVPPGAEFLPDSTFALRCFARYPSGLLLDVTERVDWEFQDSRMSIQVSNRAGEKGLVRVLPLPTDETEWNRVINRPDSVVRVIDGNGLFTEGVLRYVSDLVWRSVLSLRMIPTSAEVEAGNRLQLRALAQYSDGSEGELSDLSWSSSDSAVAGVDGKGLVRSSATGGSVRVTAFSQSWDRSVSIDLDFRLVRPVLLALGFQQSSLDLAPGESRSLSVTGFWSDRGEVDLSPTQLQFFSDRPQAVQVDANGVARAVGSSGSANIVAIHSSGLRQTLPVRINPDLDQLTEVRVTGSEDSVAAGLQLQMSATGMFAGGKEQNLTNSVQWSVTPENLASISAGGVLTGSSPGSVTVRAVKDGIAGETTIQILPPVLTELTITNLQQDNTYAVFFSNGAIFEAVGSFSDGSQSDVSGRMEWSSSDEDIFTVTSDGVGTFLEEGSAELIATDPETGIETRVTIIVLGTA